MIGAAIGIKSRNKNSISNKLNLFKENPSLSSTVISNSQNHEIQKPKKIVRIHKNILSAPNGFAINGGTVINPTINNYAPPPKPERAINDESKAKIISTLSILTGAASIQGLYGDNESIAYAQIWREIFRKAGWKIIGGNMYMTEKPVVGAIIKLHGENTRNKDGRLSFEETDPSYFAYKALLDQKVPTVFEYEPSQEINSVSIFIGLSSSK